MSVNLDWGCTEFTLLGIQFSTDMRKILDLNLMIIKLLKIYFIIEKQKYRLTEKKNGLRKKTKLML